MLEPFKLEPIYQPRVWGGYRLQPDSTEPVGEAWLVYEGCRIAGGRYDGRTLAEVASKEGARLLGEQVLARTGTRFPLLIKILHSTEWLSVQVHPNDEQARRLEGEGHFGKTEAWHFLEAEPGAAVVYGLSGNRTSDDLAEYIAAGRLADALNVQRVQAGDTLFTPAGCVHAIGPGLLTYEVQQTSDITYRIHDWDRPASAGRELHLDKGLAVIGDCAGRQVTRLDGEGSTTLASCAFFALRMVRCNGGNVELETGMTSFHAVTVSDGSVEIIAGEGSIPLGLHETVVVPASAGAYRVSSDGPFSLLLSYVP